MNKIINDIIDYLNNPKGCITTKKVHKWYSQKEVDEMKKEIISLKKQVKTAYEIGIEHGYDIGRNSTSGNQ